MCRKTRLLAPFLCILILVFCIIPCAAYGVVDQAPTTEESTEEVVDSAAVVELQLTDSAEPSLSFTSWRSTRSCENNDGWSHGEQGFDDTLRVDGSDGSVAYCLDPQLSAPQTDVAYGASSAPSLRVFAILYLGYPNTTTIGGLALEPDQARSATQLALWALIGDENMQMDHWHSVSEDYGARIIAAATALLEQVTAYPDIAADTQTVNEYFGFSSLDLAPSYQAQWFGDDLIRFGEFGASALLGNARLVAEIDADLPANAYFGDETGAVLEELPVASNLYLYVPHADLPDNGRSQITFMLDYRQDTELVWYSSGDLQRIVDSGGTGVFQLTDSVELNWGSCEGIKTTTDGITPIPDTTFSLYRCDEEDTWVKISCTQSDGEGRYRFDGLPYGNYKVVETIPASGFMLPSESGTADYAILDIATPDTVTIPPFQDHAISIGCEVRKTTIRVTSAAFSSRETPSIDNVGKEAIAYDIDYRNTSNVAVDEFTVDDPLEAVAAGQVHVVELWSPVSHGDTDGLMNIWYKTNECDDTTTYSDASAMADNPFNPRNPDGSQQMSSQGWKLWAQNVECASQIHLTISDLGLSEDEYITELRFEHGSVQADFTTGASQNWETASADKADSPEKASAILDDPETPRLKPATYLVTATEQLSPVDADGNDTLIINSVTAHAYRDITLHATDTDVVETRVIDSFSFPSSQTSRARDMAATGDTVAGILIIGAITAAAGILILARRCHSIKQRH